MEDTSDILAQPLTEPESEVLWRETVGDLSIAVRHFSYQVQEQEAAQLKNAKFDFDKVVATEITRFTDRFSVKQFAFYAAKGLYVQIKKVDEAKKVYTVKARLTESEEKKKELLEDIEVPFEALSDQISVNVRVISEEQQMNAQLQINIHEKLSFLRECIGGPKCNTLSIIYNGELAGTDDTFIKRSVKQGDNFLLMGGSFEAKQWKRFPKLELGDYFYMSDTYFDAIAFKALREVNFLGFGLCNRYEKKDFTIKFKWAIDDTMSEDYEVQVAQDEIDSETQTYRLDFQKLGISPVSVSADSLIHIMATSHVSGEPNRYIYGYHSSNSGIVIEGQE